MWAVHSVIVYCVRVDCRYNFDHFLLSFFMSINSFTQKEKEDSNMFVFYWNLSGLSGPFTVFGGPSNFICIFKFQWRISNEIKLNYSTQWFLKLIIYDYSCLFFFSSYRSNMNSDYILLVHTGKKKQNKRNYVTIISSKI